MDIPKGEECYEWIKDGYGDIYMRICPHWFMIGNDAFCDYMGKIESTEKQNFLKEHIKICDKE